MIKPDSGEMNSIAGSTDLEVLELKADKLSVFD